MQDQELFAWLECHLHKRRYPFFDEALWALVESARRLVKIYLERSKKLHPSEVVRELNSLATNLKKGDKAKERLGNHGLLMIAAMPEASLDTGDLDVWRHILYLRRIAALSCNAAEAAKVSAEDDKGGLAPTQELQELISALMCLLGGTGIRPTHLVDKHIHLTVARFTGFVKEARRLYDRDQET